MASDKTVLVIEDDQDARFVLGAILNHDGYRVLEARDGTEGVTLAMRHLPDVIVMDIHMPGISGIEAAELLRRHEATRDIPVVAVTADRFRQFLTRERAEEVFHSVLWKPIMPRRLMDHIRGVIGDP